MVDPVKHLSSEALTQIFSHLSTPALTRCNSVSKTWRREILVDSVLHRNLDLTSIGDSLSQIELMQLISDLAARSARVYREMHLDLAPFWKELAKASRLERFDGAITFDKAMAATSYNYISLLTMLRLATKDQLEKLYITVSSYDDAHTYPDTVSLSQVIIQGAVSLDQLMAGLKELHFSVPFPFSMALRGYDSGSKRFTVMNRWLAEPFEGDGLLCLGFLTKAQVFAGNYLEMFEMDDVNFESLSDENQFERRSTFDLFFQEVQKSATLLTKLSLRFKESDFPDAALHLVFNCPRLSFLKLDLRNHDTSEDPMKCFKPPSPEFISSIKSIDLRLDRVNFNWESKPLQSWFGSSLEYLCLSYGYGSFTSSFLEIPIEALHSILSHCGVLKKLRIEGVSVTKSSTSPTTFELSLKSLETLELVSMENLGLGIFDSLFAPNLKRLNILLSSTSGHERQIALVNLSYLLRASRSSLKELLIQSQGEALDSDSEYLNLPNTTFTMSKLKKLRTDFYQEGSWRLLELLDLIQLPRVKEVIHTSSPRSGQMSTQALAASSFSVESIAIRSSVYLQPSFSSESMLDVKKFQGSELPTFSNLKCLYLGKHSIFFLGFFSRSQTGKLGELVVTLEYEDEETKSSVLQDLMRLLSSNRLSLIKVRIERWPMTRDESLFSSRFFKYESDSGMLKEISEAPVEFSNLKSIAVEGCNPLLKIFQSCFTPSLSEVHFSHLTSRYYQGLRSMTGDEFEHYDEDFEFKKESELIHRTIKAETEQTEAEESDSEEEEDYGEMRERERQREAEIDQEQRSAKRIADWI